MVNTEPTKRIFSVQKHYNILNIVVNTEPPNTRELAQPNYNILNIVVNTEQHHRHYKLCYIITY